jgi:hypothetical protein
VVASFLRFHDPGGPTGKDAVAPTFDRIASFRTGFTTAFDKGLQAGLAACNVPAASAG